MNTAFRAAKGTRDILPDEAACWQRVEDAARAVFALYAFREIRTPIFESTDLFHRSTGVDTDIVGKEMYTFEDRAGRSLTLRPEGTPGVLRAALEHGMIRRGELHRLYYIGAMFRYERPQKGRYRQFSQIGVEAFGSAHPALDAEIMQMGVALFTRLGLTGLELQINSVGHSGCRPAFREALRGSLLPLKENLCADCQRRLEGNPLRVLDCKVPECIGVRGVLPGIDQYLCAECRDHFDAVKSTLTSLEVPFTINPRLVRGLDYYMRTTFEVVSGSLGSQNAVCGGGRYDDLIEAMGGEATPGVGFAIGADRLVMLVSEQGPEKAGTDIFLVHIGAAALAVALRAARGLRDKGLTVRLDPEPRDMKKQMARASASLSRYALIIGEREMASGRFTLKRLSDGVQREVEAENWESIRQEVRDGRE